MAKKKDLNLDKENEIVDQAEKILESLSGLPQDDCASILMVCLCDVMSTAPDKGLKEACKLLDVIKATVLSYLEKVGFK